MLLGVDGAAALTELEAAARTFAAQRDDDGEALALTRQLVVLFWRSDLSAIEVVLARLSELAEAGVERARSAVDLSGAYAHLVAGEPRRAIEIAEAEGLCHRADMAGLAGFLVSVAHLDLGDPERALLAVEGALPWARGRLRGGLMGVRLEAEFLLGLPEEQDGVESMELHLALVRSFGVAENTALTLAGFALVDARYGDVARARGRLEDAKRAAAAAVGLRAAAAVGVAEASILLVEGDESRAAAVLAATVADQPLGSRPDRSYLRILPALYLLLPPVRGLLDGLDLAGSWEAARRVGQALVALREDGDVAPASALDWSDLPALRAIVAAPLLAELATAALARGVDEARDAFDVVPVDLRPCLRRLATHDLSEVATAARELLVTVAARPREAIEIRVLGPVELWRGGAPVDERDWRRERVRSLLLLLVDRRRLSRERLAATLWPDLEEPAPSHNLRTNLGHLQRLLQPDRAAGEPGWFLKVDDDRCELVDSDLLQIDADEFDRSVAAGREADERGAPALALEHYLTAVRAYRGEYLADAPDETWGEFERVRLRSAYAGAATRAGELILGLGDVDEAFRLATLATEAEPFHEAGHRLHARSLEDSDDRAGAWRLLSDTVDGLRAEGLEPEPATLRLLDSLADPARV
jgi:DNA-binding SARP family transcriptional activator